MNETKTLKDFTLVELKGMAYDCIADRERAEKLLSIINEEIGIRVKTPVTPNENTVAPAPVEEENK